MGILQKKGELSGIYEGPVIIILFKLAAPVFIGMFFQLLYSIVDTIWISRIDLNDPSYVGGLGIVLPLVFLTIATSSGILVGVGSLIARAIGKKDYELVNSAAETGLLLSSILSIIVIAIGYIYSEEILIALGGRGDYLKHALEYFKYIIPAAAFTFMAGVFHGILQGEGYTEKIMIGMLIATILNIILDPIFIFKLGLRVKGAAIATLVAHLLSGIYFVYIFLKYKDLTKITWSFHNISLKAMKEIVAVGFPQSAGQITFGLSYIFYNRLISNINTQALTSFSLCLRFDQILTLPMTAIAYSLITIAGQNYGSGNFERIKRAWKESTSATALLILFLVTMLIIFARPIFSFFTDVDTVVQISVMQVKIIEYSYIASSVAVLATALFQAIAMPMPGLIITLIRLIAISVPLAHLLVIVFNFGMLGIWIGIISGNITAALVGLFWIRKRLHSLMNYEKIKI